MPTDGDDKDADDEREGLCCVRAAEAAAVRPAALLSFSVIPVVFHSVWEGGGFSNGHTPHTTAFLYGVTVMFFTCLSFTKAT